MNTNIVNCMLSAIDITNMVPREHPDVRRHGQLPRLRRMAPQAGRKSDGAPFLGCSNFQRCRFRLPLHPLWGPSPLVEPA